MSGDGQDASSPSQQSEGLLHGSEVLLFDGDARVRAGFRKLLQASDVMVTATDDRALALSLAAEKHFAVAVLDLDTPERNGGLEMMAQLRQRSPATQQIVMAVRQGFDIAVAAFRQGARDVVAKSPENVGYIADTVLHLCSARRNEKHQRRLLGKMLEVHEEFLQRLMEASRRAAQAEERTSDDTSAQGLQRCVLLVVDDDEQTSKGLESALAREGDYEVQSVLTGGEALDFVGRNPFQVALVKDGLPDLPSTMVAKSLRAESSDGIVLLFSHPTEDQPGRADIIETNQSIELIAELHSGEQLVEQVHELREAFVTKARERRYLQVFRRDHYDFLRRYVDLRQEITRALAAIDD
jgi:DNA-binding NtrC family response regulator